MTSSRGKINFGQPSVSSLASKELVRMLAFDNTSSQNTWIYQPIVSTLERSLVFIPSRIKDRESLSAAKLHEIICVSI